MWRCLLMKNKKTLLIILGLVLVLVVSVFLNRSPQLDSVNPLPTAEGDELKQNEVSTGNSDEILADVNSSLVKGYGDLAFISKDFLYMIDGTTGEIKQLTESGQAIYPRWSYDGNYLAFIRITDAKSNSGTLWICRRDGKEAYQVQGLPGPIGAGDFQWSPTEHLLAVGSWNLTDGIWLVPVNEKPQQLVETGNSKWFAWSPDGKQIAYSVIEDSETMGDVLYTIAIEDGKIEKRLDLSSSGTGIEVAKWWPDGKGLLYWANAAHSSSIRADGLSLWSLNLDDGEPKELDDTLTYTEWLDFSPDGKLVMTSGSGRSLWYWKKLALADVRSGSVEHIKPPEGSVAFEPAFSPNGKKIAFIAAQEMDEITFQSSQEEWFKSRTLWVSDADGSNAKPIVESKVYSPQWSKDGNYLFYVQDNALWRVSVDGEKPEMVFRGLTGEDTWGFYGHIRYSDLFDYFK